MAFGEIEDEAGFLKLIGEEVHRQFSKGAAEVWMHQAVTAAAQQMGQDESDAYDFANDWSGDIWSLVAVTLTVIEHWDGSVEYPSDCISVLRFGNDYVYVGYDRNPERFVDDDRIVAELAPDDEEGLQAWSEETEYLESVPESHGMTPEEWDRHLMVSAATAGTLDSPSTEDESAPEEVAEVDLPERGKPVMMGFHKINFESDREVSELSKGIAAAIVSKAKELGMKTGTRTEGPATTITRLGGVAIPPEHGNSQADADAYLAQRARESGQ
jgi:hypothetical protein